MTRTKKKERQWSPEIILDGVRDAYWIEVRGEGVDGLQDRDHLLVDRTLRKPKDGDYTVWETAPGKFTIHQYDSDYEYDGMIWAVGVAIVRKFSRKAKRSKSSPNDKNNECDKEIASLQRKLDKLERLPENEAISLQLESEIYKLKRQSDDEWPNVIGAAQ